MKLNIKKTLAATTLAAASLSIFSFIPAANAHGYVKDIKSRAYMCQLGMNKNCGNITYEPQSLERPKGFPQAGPKDGSLASADGIRGFEIDEQSPTRWAKNNIKTGPNQVTWEYTQVHHTTKWEYFMTKPGWNQNKPFTRADLEKIGEVKWDGTDSRNNTPHTINVPKDRSGYHVIYAVWTIDNTEMAFYNTLDVNVEGGEQPVLPDAPSGLHSMGVTQNSASIMWKNNAANAKENIIYRDGVEIKRVPANVSSFNDTGLKADTNYTYQVAAVGQDGTVSNKTDGLQLRTTADETLAPNAPSGIHSMGTTTNSVDLMWANNSSNIAENIIYRDGQEIARVAGDKRSYMDEGLNSDTEYTYTVVALGKNGQMSDRAADFKVRTKPDQPAPSGDAWDSKKAYTKGDVVVHEGKKYVCVQSYQGHGDPNWIDALSLWSPQD